MASGRLFAAVLAILGFAGIWGAVVVIVADLFGFTEIDLDVYVRFVATVATMYFVGVLAFRALS